MNGEEEFKPTPVGKDNCHEFWNSIESYSGFVVPTYIRNVLKLHGFNSAMSVKLIDEEDFNEMENFAKSGGMQRALASDVNLVDFYGPFAESKEDFKILRGYRKILIDISTLIREKWPAINAKNNEFQSTRISGIIKAYDRSSRNNLLNEDIELKNFTSATTTKFKPTTAFVDDQNGKSLLEKPNASQLLINGMPKISVRRKCVHLESLHNSRRHPYSKARLL